MSASKEKVLDFLRISMSQEAVDSILETAKQYITNQGQVLPETMWNDYKSLYDIDELYRRLTPIYQDYFEDEDLDYVIEFLTNPKSQRYVKLITSEAYSDVANISMDYMNEVVNVVLLKMENYGYDDIN
jgi:hypothetical protein